MENSPEILQSIVERNKRVEAEKAWETSWTRKGFIMAATYITACVFLRLLGNMEFLIHALVPTGGYFLSTLSLPWVKRRWMTKYKSSKD